jgi:hypothetical protein
VSVKRVLYYVAQAQTYRSSALSATAPFPRLKPRLRLAAVLGPACLLSLVTTSYALMKICTLFIGFAFFGDPMIRRGIRYLNRQFPKWQKIIELQKYRIPRIITTFHILTVQN